MPLRHLIQLRNRFAVERKGRFPVRDTALFYLFGAGFESGLVGGNGGGVQVLCCSWLQKFSRPYKNAGK